MILPVILAGGSGTRLYPLTYTSAKQLIPVANKPVLYRVIEAIRDAGITEIGIVVGNRPERIIDAVGHGGQFGVDITANVSPGLFGSGEMCGSPLPITRPGHL